MTIPANLILEGAPYGPQPVVPVLGPQGGPYTVRGPVSATLLPSAPRTVSTSSAALTNYGYRGVYLVLDVTVNPGGAQTLSVDLILLDPVTGRFASLITIPASATPGGIWCLYPGLSGGAVGGIPATANLPLPSSWVGKVTHSGAGAWTYSLTGILLP